MELNLLPYMFKHRFLYCCADRIIMQEFSSFRYYYTIYMRKAFYFTVLSLLLNFSFAAAADDAKMIFSYRSFWPEFKAMEDFKNAGIDTVAMLPSNSDNSLGEPYGKYPTVWAWHDTYDWESFDKQFDDIIKVNPNAQIVCLVDLNSPRWLARHLAMCSRNLGMEADSFTQLSNCLANKNWRTLTKKFAAEFFKRAEGKYGKHIKGYLLACGQTDEWMDYSCGVATANKTDAWHKWLAKKGYPDSPIPEITRLEKASFENRLRDPQSEGDIIRYAEFTSDIVADGIEEFAKLARENVAKERLVGSFYGYIMELTGPRLVWCGHLSYERLFNSPYLDFFASPAAYGNRAMGEGSGFMCAYETLKRFDKNWLHEIDLRTHTYNSKLSKHISISTSGMLSMTKNQQETNAALKREFCLATVKGASLWCFDMWGGVFKTPESMATVKRAHEIWREHAGKKYEYAAEVALVADPRSTLYINRSNLTHETYNVMRKRLNLVSAPFDIISFGDIGHIDMSKYKTVILPAMFEVTPERRKILDKHLLKDNRTVVFLYAPAISDGKTLDTSRIKELTGFAYGAKGVNRKPMDGWESVYIHEYKDATIDVLKDIVRKSGANIYLEENVPVYANERLLAVHVAQTNGKTTAPDTNPDIASPRPRKTNADDGSSPIVVNRKLKIKLPKKYKKIVELFSGKTVAENADEFIYDFPSPDTALFETLE